MVKEDCIYVVQRGTLEVLPEEGEWKEFYYDRYYCSNTNTDEPDCVNCEKYKKGGGENDC